MMRLLSDFGAIFDMQSPSMSGGMRAGPVSDGTVLVRLAKNEDQSIWNEFVETTNDASFFHLFGWRGIFKDVFGLNPQYLLAERHGKLVGILPLAHQNSLLFGNALISSPFCVLGGPIGVDRDVENALDEAAIALAKRFKSRSLEYRSRNASREGWSAKRDFYATFVRDIASDHDKNLSAIPRKQRAVLRKAIQGELRGSVDTDVSAFFRVYSESMRNLGTPMFPIGYFKALLRTFAGSCDIVVIRDGELPVSTVMNFYFKGTVLPYYGGGTSKARYNGGNDLLYWEVMRRAVERGCHKFDFGRSKAGTGAFSFKKNWGFEPQWLEYEYWLPEGSKIPSKNPTNPVYANLSRIWKKLPLPVANFIGPFLIRGLG
jgi:FemAB-related protein (PEP-CTERM system-associated)